jgi:hypothetical protein
MSLSSSRTLISTFFAVGFFHLGFIDRDRLRPFDFVSFLISIFSTFAPPELSVIVFRAAAGQIRPTALFPLSWSMPRSRIPSHLLIKACSFSFEILSGLNYSVIFAFLFLPPGPLF